MSTQPQKDADLQPASFPFASPLPNWLRIHVIEFLVEGTKVTAAGIPSPDGEFYEVLSGEHTPQPEDSGFFTTRTVARVPVAQVRVNRKATRRVYRGLLHSIKIETKPRT